VIYWRPHVKELAFPLRTNVVMSDPVWTLTARWIFPVSTPPLERGTVTIDGERIVAVEPHGVRHVDLDLGDAVVLPGLVNAHTHLDLSGMRGLTPPSSDFVGWLKQVIRHRRNRTTQDVHADMRAGLAECLRTGTTLLGDISGDGGSWDVLAASPVCAVVFREMLGLPEHRASAAWERLDQWLAAHPAMLTCRPGVSPHAPYSVRSSLFRAAATRGWPVAVHLAETAEEQELLVGRRGPFVSFLRDLDVWAPDGLAHDTDHVLGLLNGPSPTLLVHGNFLSVDAAIPRNASLVYCPRTHAAFGHPPHPFLEFLARGVTVALGTDSLASNPDLDLLAEARFLHRQRPDTSPATLLRMATLSGAEALGWADVTGSFDPGKFADLIALPLPESRETQARAVADPHRLIFDSDQPVTRVLWRGRWRGETAG
jgi:cytosine/adenosine deaminase-related metal-dependent hydrolase